MSEEMSEEMSERAMGITKVTAMNDDSKPMLQCSNECSNAERRQQKMTNGSEQDRKH